MKIKTNIRMTQKCEREVRAYKKLKMLDEIDSHNIGTWVREIHNRGLKAVQSELSWNDHRLEKELSEYRSASFSSSGRIIYKVLDENNIEIVEVKRITPDHDYDLSKEVGVKKVKTKKGYKYVKVKK